MKKEITVLDTKRSNAINIGLTVLPNPRAIKAAILKMDGSVINKEGIEVIDKIEFVLGFRKILFNKYLEIINDASYGRRKKSYYRSSNGK